MAARVDAIDYVFVLRFWRELPDDTTGSMDWRASISDVNTGRQFHALGVEGACDILRNVLMPDCEIDTGK